MKRSPRTVGAMVVNADSPKIKNKFFLTILKKCLVTNGNEGSDNKKVPIAGHEAGGEGEGGPDDDTQGHQVLSGVTVSKISEYWSCL